MIHQLIFAAPKPGMSVADFQSYWLDVHAPQFASKIPQIKKYKVDTVVPFAATGEPLWNGIAEIWLADEADQLASMQTTEFLQGARLDEPNWAAFWQTVVLDTDDNELLPVAPGMGIKLFRLVKRQEGLGLQEFRDRSLSKYAELVLEVPGLGGYVQGHTRDGAYGVGEAVLDMAHQMWFADLDALSVALASDEFRLAEDELGTLIEARYLHQLVTEEHWVIGPESR